MQLNDRDKELLAKLAGEPGFKILIELFREHEFDLLEAISKTAASEDLLRRTRLYQYFRATREFLATRPEAAADELEALAAQALVHDDPVGKSPADVWFERFVKQNQ